VRRQRPAGTVAALCDPVAGRIGLAFEKRCVARGVDPARAVPACVDSGLSPVDCMARATVCQACTSVTEAAELDPALCAADCTPP
jgi:hypothetical protein